MRHFTAAAEHYGLADGAARHALRSSYPRSAVSNAISRSSGRAPFGSTLRPNVTGGTLGRTAGGYTLGSGRVGGARYFSHGPAVQSHVVQNVSQAVRAFVVGGQKAQFSGYNPHTGEKRYKAVSTTQDGASRKMLGLPRQTPGSYVEFAVNPTITAMTLLGSVAGYGMSTVNTEDEHQHVNTLGLLDVLSVDFSRALRDLATILNDLKKLSALGDLPITCQTDGRGNSQSLRIHFPGCDADTVEVLCQELAVQRGIVVQDEEFDAFAGTEIALLFPFAPSTATSMDGEDAAAAAAAEDLWFQQPHQSRKEPVDWAGMITPSDVSDHDHDHELYSIRSAQTEEEEESEHMSFVFAEHGNAHPSPSASTPSGYETLHYSSSSAASVRGHHANVAAHAPSPLEYQGFEGIWRFIEQCDSACPRK